MKTLRLISIWIGLAAALLVVLVLTAIAPPVQTWAAELALNHKPGVQASLGSLAAGFGRIDVEQAHIEVNGVVLTVPLLQAQVPLTTALLRRKVSIGGLVAKGWKLDLSRAHNFSAKAMPDDGQNGAGAVLTDQEGVSARRAAFLLLGGLTSLKLPFELSLDDVELEGDVLLPGPPGKAPVQIHVTLVGGGLAAGHEGTFTFDTAAQGADSPSGSAFSHGKLVVVMKTPSSVDAVRIETDLTVSGESMPKTLAMSVAVSAIRSEGGGTYTLKMSRGGRRLATFTAKSKRSTSSLEGTWKVELSESDLAPFSPFDSLPAIAAVGEGSFEADEGLAHVHALGRLRSTAGNLAFIAPVLGRIGKTTLDANFDVTRTGPLLHVDHLSLSLATTQSEILVKSKQVFDFNAGTGALAVSLPDSDFIEGSLRGFPLEWLSSPTSRFRFTAGEAKAQFVVRAHDGGFALRLKDALRASGVSLSGPGMPEGHRLDLKLALLADYNPKGWQVTLDPSSVDAEGLHLASIDARASQVSGSGQPILISGNVKVDLDALTAQPGSPSADMPPGQLASCEFTGQITDAAEMDCKVSVASHDPNRSISAKVHVNLDSEGDFSFEGPVHFNSGKTVSEISTEGSGALAQSGGQIDLKLTTEDAGLGDLCQLAGALAAAGGSHPAQSPKAHPVPFWGDWIGPVAFSAKRLRTADGDLEGVGATFNLDHGQMRIETGRIWLLNHNLGKFEGSVAFDANRPLPYVLKGTGSVEDVDAAALFGAPAVGQPAAVEGHFSIVAALVGEGSGPEDLTRSARTEFRLKSSSGILRVLKTSVSESIPEASTPVTDTLGSVGSAVGMVFGIKKSFDRVDKNSVSPAADAVINFTYAISEIGFDRFSITADGGYERALRLTEIAIDCPEERLRGSGVIESTKGLPLFKRPLSVDLELSAKGQPADLLKKAGLLSPRKDADGFTAMMQHFQLGGALGQLDASSWHALLVKAVIPSEPAKKNGE